MHELPKIGYEITIRIPGIPPVSLDVDETRNILSYGYTQGPAYLSDWERWYNPRPYGTVTGDMKKGEKITALGRDGATVLTFNEHELRDVEVVNIKQVDMAQMLSDPYIAGVDRPIWKPGAQN